MISQHIVKQMKCSLIYIFFPFALLSIIINGNSCASHQQIQSNEAIPDDPMRTAVTIDTTHSGLTLYYPHMGTVELVTANMPEPTAPNIIFCCAAAFTGNTLTTFNHKNIAGDHVSDGGKRHEGYRCPRNNGAFVFYDGEWQFLYKNYSSQLDSAEAHHGMGFGQEMMIHDGKEVPHTRSASDTDMFRALCEIDGELCIADACGKETFGAFINHLLQAGATEALYLDMGSWKHSWLRKEVDGELDGPATIIHEKEHSYGTNWITFYYSEDSINAN